MWKRFRKKLAHFWWVLVVAPATAWAVFTGIAMAVPWMTVLAMLGSLLACALAVAILSWREERIELLAEIGRLKATPPMPPSIRQEFRDLMRIGGMMNESVRHLGANPHNNTFAAEARKYIVDFGDLIGAFGEWPSVRRSARDLCHSSSIVLARATGLESYCQKLWTGGLRREAHWPGESKRRTLPG